MSFKGILNFLHCDWGQTSGDYVLLCFFVFVLQEGKTILLKEKDDQRCHQGFQSTTVALDHSLWKRACFYTKNTLCHILGVYELNFHLTSHLIKIKAIGTACEIDILYNCFPT